MLASLLTPALLAAAAALPAAQADTTTTRYRIETRSESVFDLSGVPGAGGEQRQTVGMASFITVRLADTAGGRSLRVVIDSMTVEPGTPIPPAALDSVRGMVWTGFVTPQGEVKDLKSTQNFAAGQQLQTMLSSFFPRTRSDLSQGQRWTDTLQVSNQDSTSSSSTRTITQWTVAGKEARTGVQATRLDATFNVDVRASGQTPQGAMQMEGTGSGKATYFVGPNGRYLGGTSESQNDATLSLDQMPMPIPVSATTTTTITVL